jgi:hypothetical protein
MYIHGRQDATMARMIRKQVYIEPRQEELLKARADALGVTEAELIRRGINEVLNAELSEQERLAIWEEMKDYIKKNRSMKVPQTGRNWTREDLYEERLARYSH